MSKEETVAVVTEALADYAHEAWSGWMNYFLSRCKFYDDDGSLVVPGEYVKALRKQIATPTRCLIEAEKDLDRTEAAKMIEVIDKACRKFEDERESQLTENYA